MSSSKHILLIGGSHKVNELLTAKLEKSGFRVTASRLGKDALNRLQKQEYAMVLCNARLPDMDALQLCSTVRKSFESSDLLLMLLSSDDSVKSRVAALDAGADDCLGKPFHLSELIARVETLFRLRSRLRGGGIKPPAANSSASPNPSVPGSKAAAPPEDKKKSSFRVITTAHVDDEGQRLFQSGKFEQAMNYWLDAYRKKPAELYLLQNARMAERRLFAELMKNLKSLDAVPERIIKEPDEIVGLDFNAQEGYIFSLVDDQTSIRNLVKTSTLGKILTLTLLAQLVERNALLIA